jgi:phage terminase large subunit-like protein
LRRVGRLIPSAFAALAWVRSPIQSTRRSRSSRGTALVRRACERHLDDLGSAGASGLRFDLAAARHALEFFGFLRHSKGEWAGQTFTLAPWQAFVVGALFGAALLTSAAIGT